VIKLQPMKRPLCVASREHSDGAAFLLGDPAGRSSPCVVIDESSRRVYYVK
jgi:hypothetical protein